MAAILIVDDSASIRATLKITLSGEGHAVSEAGNGTEGLSQAASGKYDLVITDLNMPQMDGLTMIKQMRTLPDYAGVPILFLTTESDPTIKVQAKNAGATGWVTKPFQPDQLCRIVTKVLAR